MADNDFPSIDAADPSTEESKANQRALTLGLIAGGLGILAQPRYRGEPSSIPIARGAETGLQAGLGYLSDRSQGQLKQQQLDLENRRLTQQGTYQNQMLGIDKQRADAATQSSGAMVDLRNQQAADKKPIGKDAGDPFAGWRDDPRMKEALPPVDQVGDLTPQDIRSIRSSMYSHIMNNGGAVVPHYIQEDDGIHEVLKDKTGKTVSDSVIGQPKPTGAATATDKTKDEPWLDPKTGYKWNVLRDLNTGKAITIGPDKSGAADAYTHWGRAPTLPPPVSEVPDWSPLEKAKNKQPATAAEAAPSTHGLKVGDAAPKADGDYHIRGDTVTVKDGKVAAIVPSLSAKVANVKKMMPPPAAPAPAPMAPKPAAAPAAMPPAAPAMPAAAPVAPKPAPIAPAVAPTPPVAPAAGVDTAHKVTPSEAITNAELDTPAIRLPNGMVVMGRRGESHADIINSLPKKYDRVEHGFIDKEGNFVTRTEARDKINEKGGKLEAGKPESADLSS